MTVINRNRSARLAIVAALLALVLIATGCTAFKGSDDFASDGAIEPDFDTATQERMVATEDEMLAEAGEEAAMAPPSSDAASVPSEDRLVIRNYGMRVEVETVETSIDDIRALTDAAGGTITALNVSTDVDGPVYRYEAEGTLSDGAPLAAYMTVRVPAEKLDGFIADIADLGKVLREYASEQDVTQEHVDLSARLANLQAQEERLRSFFEQATKVEEMLAIEAELGRVRGEIESMQAQIDYLERQAAMATLTIELTEPKAVVRPSGESWGFVESLTTSIRAFVGTINAMIIFSGAILPIAVLALVAFFVIRAVVRRRSRKTGDDPTEG